MLSDKPTYKYQVYYLEVIGANELVSRHENVVSINEVEACYLVRTMFSCRRIQVTGCKRV